MSSVALDRPLSDFVRASHAAAPARLPAGLPRERSIADRAGWQVSARKPIRHRKMQAVRGAPVRSAQRPRRLEIGS